MFNSNTLAYRLRTPFLSVSLLALVAGSPVIATTALAQDAGRPTVSKKPAAASNSTINLVNLLVQQGVLNEDQAAALIKQAEDEAYVAREAARDATVKADEAAKAATAATAAASPPGSKRVTYVPEIVKRQLRDDLRREVMAQAKDEGWASPGKYPEWASRIRFSGDFRGRWEAISFPTGYNSTGQIYDFNAINTGSPYDISQSSNPFIFAPLYNTTENRNRARLRARLGMEADLYEGFTAGLRIATGSDSAPVSTNQTLGGSGGNFSKYALWLDRAFVKYEPFKNTNFGTYADPSSLALTVGRFDNPFWSPTELVWDADLGFDGMAVQARQEILPGFTPFAVAGAFPIFNTALDFATTEPVKFKSEDKYLFGGQVGFNWRASPLVDVAFGGAIFDFHNVQGRLSSPCDLSIQQFCDTDHLRSSFAQKGNTYRYLRDIMATAQNNFGRDDQFHYYGLASQYRPAVFSGRVEFAHFAPITIGLDGEYVWNTAFDRNAIEAVAVNNRGPDTIPGVVPGPFEGGNIGWLTRLTVGNKKLAALGDWNAHVGYKYLESDAVMDAFADSDFGLGGTNLKGYFLGGNVALASNVWATARWMSANSIAGSPYAVDIVQIDLNAKF
jgi:hypothetical protein